MVDMTKVPECELSRRLGGDSTLVRKLLCRFSANLPILIVRLSLAIKSNDASRAKSQITMFEEVAKSIGAADLEDQLSMLRVQLADLPAENPGLLQTDVETIAVNFRQHLEKRFAIPPEDRPDSTVL